MGIPGVGGRPAARTLPPMTHSLVRYVEIWWQAVDDLSTLLESLAPDDWSAPTDLAGWDRAALDRKA